MFNLKVTLSQLVDMLKGKSKTACSVDVSVFGDITRPEIERLIIGLLLEKVLKEEVCFSKEL